MIGPVHFAHSIIFCRDELAGLLSNKPNQKVIFLTIFGFALLRITFHFIAISQEMRFSKLFCGAFLGP